ncbi:MAG: amino acid permease [Gammaproteobacteria bacterium]|nr:amino acid permease [Gammaproteobacteria bacterium]
MSDRKGKLGLFMLIALVTGNMVGSGAFLLPANLARVGSIGLLSLIFTVIGVLCLALVFAKMSLLIPKTGGPYVYASAAFGEYMGFQTAYYYWIAVLVGNASIVVATIGYLNVFFPLLNDPIAKTLAILAVIWSLTIVNIIGIRFAGFVQIITTILKFTPLLLVGILGWWFFHPEYLVQNFNVTSGADFSAFSSAIVLTLWLFVGVESASIPSDSVHNPQRNIPIATVLGTAVAAVVYIISNTAIFGMLPNDVLANSTAPFAVASEIIFGEWGKVFVAIGAIIACLGALNGWILIAAQIPMAAAYDGLFPKIFAKCSRPGIPVAGLVITSAGVSFLVLASTYLKLIEQFELLIIAATTASVVAYFYTAIAEIIILPKKPLGHKNIFHLCVAIVAAAYSFFAILSSNKEVMFYLAGFILFTIPLYAIFRWNKKVV